MSVIPAEIIKRAIELDAAGFPPVPGESADEFFDRCAECDAAVAGFYTGLKDGDAVELFGGLKVCASEAIPAETLSGAHEVTQRLYGFAMTGVPGFFLGTTLGLLWGGCMFASEDGKLAVFLLRPVFRNRERWLFYRRTELAAHELCHAARRMLDDSQFEEYFAYQTSPSWLRRHFGNCFIHDRDAILFVIGALLLPIAQAVQTFWLAGFQTGWFWGLALWWPGWLVCRNLCSERVIRRAGRSLLAAGFRSENINAVLFRLSNAEIQALARQNPALAAEYVSSHDDLHWQVIRARFGGMQ